MKINILILASFIFTKYLSACINAEIPQIGYTDSIICDGEVVFLYIESGNLNDATDWYWYDTSCGLNLIGSGSGIFVNPSVTSTYYVRGEGGCTSPGACNSFTVIVHELPNPTIHGVDTICSGQTANIYISGSYEYIWSTGQTDSAISLNPTITTTYNVYLTDTNTQCDNTIFFDIHVAGEIQVSIFGNQLLCSGDTAQLSTPNIGSYIWSTGETTQSILIQPFTDTSYSVSVTDSNNCSGYASIDVLVNPIPTVFISGNDTICKNDFTNLLALGTNNFLWSTGAQSQSINVSPTTNTYYYVTITDDNNCSNMDSIFIVVKELPQITVSNDIEICYGESTTILALGTNQYIWSNGSTSSLVLVSPTSSTQYYVTGTDITTNCSVVDSVLITVNLLPNIQITGPSVVCSVTDFALNASGGDTYIWSNGETGNSILANSLDGSIFYVTGTDINGCLSSDSIQVSYLNGPPLFFSGLTSVCENQPTVINVSGADEYVWYNGDISENTTIITSTSSYFWVIGKDIISGCNTIDSVFIDITPNPLVNILGDSEICNGDSLLLVATGADQYNWSNGSVKDSTTVFPTSNTQIILFGIDTISGCYTFDTLNIEVGPVPSVLITVLKDTTCFDAENISLYGTPIGGVYTGNGVFGSTFIPAAADTGIHTITYTYTNSYNCSSTYAINIVVESCVGVEEINEFSNLINIFPNPASDYINIVSEINNFKAKIYNISGQLMHNMIFENSMSKTLDISKLPSGVYFIQFEYENSFHSKRVEIIH